MTGNFQDHKAKEQFRFDIIRAAQAMPMLCVDGVLRCDWLELAGESPPTPRLMIDANILKPGVSKFIGISSKAQEIQVCRETYKQECADGLCCFDVTGNAIEVIKGDRYPNVGVFNYDGYDMSSTLIKANIDAILRFASANKQYLGQFLLVLNVVIRSKRDIADYAKRLQEKIPSACITPDHITTYPTKGRNDPRLMAYSIIPFFF